LIVEENLVCSTKSWYPLGSNDMRIWEGLTPGYGQKYHPFYLRKIS